MEAAVAPNSASGSQHGMNGGKMGLTGDWRGLTP